MSDTETKAIIANAELAKKFADVYELVCDLEGQMKLVSNLAARAPSVKMEATARKNYLLMLAARAPSVKMEDALRSMHYTMKLIKYELEKAK